MSACSHKWDAGTCMSCKLERERDAARAEVERLREWAALQKGLKEQTQEQLDETLARCERLREALRGLLDNLTGYEHHPDLCSRTQECDEPDEGGCSYCGSDECPVCECGLVQTQAAMSVARAALDGAPSERIIHLSRVPFVALCGADKRDQTTIESDDPSDTTCQSCRDRALAERVRSRIAAAAYDAGRADLAARVRALDLDALMEEP